MAATLTEEKQLTSPAGDEEIIDDTQERLFLIPQLVGVLRWIEELIVALSGYGIVFALAVGVVDLLTDGQLTSNAPWVDYAYAIAFAAAIAGQIIGLASRSSRSYGRGHWLRGTAYTILVLVLAATEYEAAIIFGFHKAFGTPVTVALARLGIDQSSFIQLRAGVGVFLAVLSGYLRFQPTKRKTIAQLQREAEYKRQADEIAAQRRAAGLKNFAGLVGNAGQAARAAVAQATQSTADEGTDVAPADPQEPPEEVEEVKKN